MELKKHFKLILFSEVIIIRISLFLISDSTGETVEQISKAAISQFDIKETSMKKFINVRDIYFLNKIFEEEVKDSENPIIFYTLVNEKLLDFTHDFCEQYNIPHVDILTPSILIQLTLLDKIIMLYESAFFIFFAIYPLFGR